jgi:iron complex transport system permease protein
MGQFIGESDKKGTSFPRFLGFHALPLVYPWRGVACGLTVVMTIGLVAACIGSVYIPPLTVLNILMAKIHVFGMEATWADSWATIIWEIRLPRIVLAGLVGAALGLSGATYQGLFRNPLADPYLIGVAGGAGLGAGAVLVTSFPHYYHGFSILPLAAFLGGLFAVGTAYVIARRSGGLPLTTLILAGVAISSLAGAVTSFLMLNADPDMRPLLYWLLGGFIGTQWDDILVILPYIVIGTLIMMAYGRVLNLFQVDENETRRLGVNVERAKLVLILMASLTTAAAVSVSGLIGFVGLIGPHTVRLIFGHDHRSLLPMSMLVGAGFLIVADLVARTMVSPSELPVGVVTAFCGAPFFLYLLRRGGRALT